MKFIGKANQHLELKVSGYQFPLHTTPQDYDSNWLMIFISGKTHRGSWEATDPCLLTSELKGLVKWLGNIAEGKVQPPATKEFFEPCLAFDYLERVDGFKIRITFSYELKPKWAKEDEEVYLDCQFNPEELIQLAQELQQELDKYPER